MNRLFTSSLRATALSIHARQIPLPYILVSCRRSFSVKGHNPKDERIPFQVVSLLDSETGQLHPSGPLRVLLGSINRRKHHLELVAAEPEPVVKIVENDEGLLQFRLKKDKKRKLKEGGKSQESKEIQMTWQVSDGDFSNKLSKAREELVKGSRVDIVFALKSGQPLPGPMIRTNRLDAVVEALADVADEYSTRDEKQYGNAALHLKPKPRSKST
jgi:translation initiation factor IF-3